MGVLRGTGHFNTEHGTLDYTAQEILGTFDSRVYSAVNHSDIVLSDWSKSATSYYKADLTQQSKIHTSLLTLTGTISKASVDITRTIETSLSPLPKIQSDVDKISRVLPQMETSLVAINSSVTALVKYSKDNNDILKEISKWGPFGGSGSGPGIGSNRNPNGGNNIGPGPSNDNFNDFINKFTGLVDDWAARNSGRDLSPDKLYPGLQNDLRSLENAIRQAAQAFTSPTGDFDVAGFTLAVKEMVGGYSSELVTGLVNIVVPAIKQQTTDFIEQFIENAVNSLKAQYTVLIDTLANPPGQTQSNLSITDVVLVDFVGGNFGVLLDTTTDIYDEIRQFHADTVTRLRAIESKTISGFGGVSSGQHSIQHQVQQNSRDEIDRFDDVGDQLQGSSFDLSEIFNTLDKWLPGIAGIFTGAHIGDHLKQIHDDTTAIIKETGRSRAEATQLRTAMQRNLTATYGMATLSRDDRNQALQNALRSGAVNEQHLNAIAESSIAYEKLLGTQVDFTQGWGKSLVVYNKNADTYLENVALTLDSFSNNFYVSADKLQEAAGTYIQSAQIFHKDFKGFSKAINQAVAIQAAEQEAGIMAMSPAEFMEHLAWTSPEQWTDADFLKAQRFGLGGGKLFEASMAGMDPGSEAYNNMEKYILSYLEKDQAKTKSIYESGNFTAIKSHQFMNEQAGVNSKDEAYEASVGTARKAIEGMERGSGLITPDTESGTQEATASRVATAANNTWQDSIMNMATSVEEGSAVLSSMYNFLENIGFPTTWATIIASYAGSKLIGGLLKGGAGAGAGAGGAGGLLGGAGAGAGAGGGILGGIRGAGSWFAGTRVGGFLLSSTNPAVSSFGGIGSGALQKGTAGLVKGLGTNLAGGLAIGTLLADIGGGANRSQDWVGGDDATSNIAAGTGAALGGRGSGLGNAALNAGKWAAIGTMIAPGVGTAVGGVLGGIAGAIGGEKISQGIKSITDAGSQLNDSIDLGLENTLGVFGHALGAVKNTFIDWHKNILGGLWQGIGKIFKGDIGGALSSIGGGFKDAVSDICDDWMLSAEDRIKKRKGELKAVTDETNKAQDALDKSEDKFLNDRLENAQKGDFSEVEHTGKSIFTSNADKARKGVTDASGLNSFGYNDYGAAAIVANDSPLSNVSADSVYTQAERDWAAEMDATSKSLYASGDFSAIKERQIQNALPEAAEAKALTQPEVKQETDKLKQEMYAKQGIDVSTGETGVETPSDLAVSNVVEDVSQSYVSDNTNAVSANTLAIGALTDALLGGNGGSTRSTGTNVVGSALKGGLFGTMFGPMGQIIGGAAGALSASGLGFKDVLAYFSRGTTEKEEVTKKIEGLKAKANASPVPLMRRDTYKAPETNGSEMISSPIVDSVDANMETVISLLTQIADSVRTNNKADTRGVNPITGRASTTFGHETAVNSTMVLNYQLNTY